MNTASNISSHMGRFPEIAAGVFIHSSAQVIGEVSVGRDSSIWCGAAVRGDVNRIIIGAETNVQDLCVLHVTHKSAENPAGAQLVIGDRVTIGHGVILHGCTIGDECLIGMGSLIMDGAVLERHVLLGAGSLVPEGKLLREGFLYMGRPAKGVRALTAEEIAHFAYSAAHYVKLARSYGA